MLEPCLQVTAIPPETVFTMAETTAFFEAYRHVLSGLQRIRDNDLPFQKYIVRCDKTVSEPRYFHRLFGLRGCLSRIAPTFRAIRRTYYLTFPSCSTSYEFPPAL